MQFLRIGTNSNYLDLIAGPVYVEEGGYTPSVGSHPYSRVTETINAYFATDNPEEINDALKKLDKIAYYAKRFAEANGEVETIPYISAQIEGGDLSSAPLTGLSWAWRSPLGTGDEFSYRRGIAITIERIAGWRVSGGSGTGSAIGHGSTVLIPIFDNDDVGTSAAIEHLFINVVDEDAVARPTTIIISSLKGDDAQDIYDHTAPLRAVLDATNVEEVTDTPFYPTDVSPVSDDKCAVLLNGDENEGEIVAHGNQNFYSYPEEQYLVVVRALLSPKSGGSGDDPGDPLLTVLSSLYTAQDAATDETVQVVGQFSPVYDNTIYPVGVVSIPRVADQPAELIDRFLIRLDYLGNVTTKYDLYLDAIILIPLSAGILIITEPAQLAYNHALKAFRNKAGLIHVAAPVQRSDLRVSWLPFDADRDALLHRGRSIFIVGELSYYNTSAAEWQAPTIGIYAAFTRLSLDLLMEV